MLCFSAVGILSEAGISHFKDYRFGNSTVIYERWNLAGFVVIVGCILMGYSLSWLAVRGKTPEAVREALGFFPTGEREDIPEADLSAVEMPNGWYVIVANHVSQVAPDEALAQLATEGAELVTCFVEEHVMESRATGWAEGERKWSASHDAQRARDHLEAEGHVPDAYGTIMAGAKMKQALADEKKQRVDHLFDVPVELAWSVTEFCHDEEVPGLEGLVYEVLSTGKKPSFLGRIFGR